MGQTMHSKKVTRGRKRKGEDRKKERKRERKNGRRITRLFLTEDLKWSPMLKVNNATHAQVGCYSGVMAKT